MVIGSEREHAQNERESAGDRGVCIFDRVRDDGRDAEAVPEVVRVASSRQMMGGTERMEDAEAGMHALRQVVSRCVRSVALCMCAAWSIRWVMCGVQWIVGERDVVFAAKDMEESTRTAAVSKVALL